MANIYNMSDLWNEGSTTFTAIKMNVVDTASDASSLLMDLQVGGVSQFKIGKGTGPITFEQGLVAGRTKITLPQYSEIAPENGRIGISAASNIRVYLENGVTVYGNGRIGFSSGLLSTGISSATDVTLRRDGPGILAQREGANAQTFNLYNTYTDASNYERGFMRWNSNVLEIGTEAAGTGSARSVTIKSQGVSYGFSNVGINQSGVANPYWQLTGSTASTIIGAGSNESFFGSLTPDVVTIRTNNNAKLKLDTTGSVEITTGLTVATLPAAPVVGMMARVTDAIAPAVGSTVIGGGAANALCWYNGTNWTVIGV